MKHCRTPCFTEPTLGTTALWKAVLFCRRIHMTSNQSCDVKFFLWQQFSKGVAVTFYTAECRLSRDCTVYETCFSIDILMTAVHLVSIQLLMGALCVNTVLLCVNTVLLHVNIDLLFVNTVIMCQYCRIMCQYCPIMFQYCHFMCQYCHIMCQYCHIMYQCCPIMSQYCPIMCQYCPIMCQYYPITYQYCPITQLTSHLLLVYH